MATTVSNRQDNTLQVINSQTLVNMSVVINGVQKMDSELAKVSTRVETFKQGLEDSGLGKLDLSGVFKGAGLAAPFVGAVQVAIQEENSLAEARKDAEGEGASASGLGATAQNLASLGEALDSVSAKFGQALLPALNTVVTALVPLINRLAELVAANPNLVQGLAVGALALTAMRGAVTGVLGAMQLLKVGLLASPIGLVALGIAVAAGLIMAYWEPIAGFFRRIWDAIKGPAMTLVEFFKTLFSWSPLGMVMAHWGPLSGLFDSIWRLLKALAVPVTEFFKGLFNGSPLGMVIQHWGTLGGYFETIWSALKTPAQLLKGFFLSLFEWSPIGQVISHWQPVSEVFAALWEVLRGLAAPVMGFFQTMFDWSPLGLIIKNWEPIIAWFGQWWQQLQSFIAPIQALFSGGFASFVTQVTGQVDGLVQQQQARNAGAGSSLVQGSSALVQQTAANNRTQLEGGLTVRFDNAPAGLRVDPPQTNQPGLSLTPAVGYRSLSLGGAHGD